VSYQNYPPPPPAYGPAPTSTLALVSMISGILGFTAVPFLGSIVAVITGLMARKETRGAPPTHAGDGMATAGIIMGWIGIGIGVLGGICVACAFLLPLLAIPFSFVQ
jgi:hypothetical protein